MIVAIVLVCLVSAVLYSLKTKGHWVMYMWENDLEGYSSVIEYFRDLEIEKKVKFYPSLLYIGSPFYFHKKGIDNEEVLQHSKRTMYYSIALMIISALIVLWYVVFVLQTPPNQSPYH